MQTQVAEAWRRIDSWLQANGLPPHFLPPPGLPSEAIRAAESEMGLLFPGDVRESYGIHDGTCQPRAILKLFGRSHIMPLATVVHCWASMSQMPEEIRRDLSPVPSSGPVVPDYWNNGWVPLATDEEAVELCIDLAPAAGGHYGQVIEWTRDDGHRVLATSWGAWLSDHADALEAGAYRLCFPYDWLAIVWGVSEPDEWEPDA